MWYRLAVVLCLAFPALAHAEAIICGNTTQLYYFYASIDPTKVPTCPGPFIKTVLAKNVTASQRTLYDSITRKDYIKVVDGLMVEMSQPEKDAVDAAIIANNPVKPYLDEIAVNNLCDTATLATVVSRIDTIQTSLQADIDAVTNIATAKTALTNMNVAIAGAFKKIAKCIIARRFVN